MVALHPSNSAFEERVMPHDIKKKGGLG